MTTNEIVALVARFAREWIDGIADEKWFTDYHDMPNQLAEDVEKAILDVGFQFGNEVKP